MAVCCVDGIYRLREGRHSGDSRPDIADEVHDAGTVGVFLLESILDGLGICQGRVWAVYLLGVDSHELDKLPDLVKGLCLYLGAFRIGMASVLCRGMVADGDVLGPELAYLVFLAHCYPFSLASYERDLVLPPSACDLSPTATFFAFTLPTLYLLILLMMVCS